MRGARVGALAGLVLLTACGGSGEPNELVAVPYPDDAADETADALEDMIPEAAPDVVDDGAANPGHEEPEPELELETTGPPIAATRDFVVERDEAALVSDHLLADLTGDGASEILVATVDEDHEAAVEVARWEDDAFHTTARLALGPADDLGRLRLADLGERAPRVLVLALQHQDTTRVAVWDPDEDGELEAPDECPIDAPVRLRSPLGLQLQLTCDADEASRQVLQWADGVFWPTVLDREAIAELGAEEELSEVLTGEGPPSTP